MKTNKRPSQLVGKKRKSKFSDAPVSNNAIQILDKPISGSITQQTDDYKNFVPPQFQTQDYSFHENWNSSLFQPIQEIAPMSESDHYTQIWKEYKTSMSGPMYSSHTTYMMHKPDQYSAPSQPLPPPQFYPFPAYYPSPYPGAPPIQIDFPPPPPDQTSKRSRWSNVNKN